MKLSELQTSLTDMTHEEKLTLVRSLRADRRVSKTAITQKAGRKKDKSDKMVNRFKSLSDDDQAMLIKMLQEDAGDEDKTG